MTQLNPQVHAHNANVAYQYPAWEQLNKPVQIAQQLLNLPSGLVTDLRNAMDASVMGRHSESLVNNLVSDLKRFLKFSPSESSLKEMTGVAGEHLKKNSDVMPELLKATLELATKQMTGEQLKEQFGITPELLNALTLVEKKALSADDQRLVSSLVEHLKNNPNTPNLGENLHSVASEVVANLRSFLDAEASGEHVDSATRLLRSNLQVLLGTGNSQKRTV